MWCRQAGTRRRDATEQAPDARPHAHQLSAATYVDDAPLIAPALLLALDALGERLVRAKGFVHIDGDDRRGIVQRAGGRTTLEFDRAWGERPIFGKIRYMSGQSTGRKFDSKKYIEQNRA